MQMRSKDLVDEVVGERTRKNRRFPALLAEAERRRELARALAARREARGFSQTVVAARMGTAASVVSKLEAGADVKVSTLQRYCAAIGQTFPPASSRIRRDAATRPQRSRRG
jgi:ribosome-binding protein aMBF1 (putative translation factor)